MTRLLFINLLLMPLLVLAGCERHEAIAVPSSRAAFVGSWASGSNFFHLSPDGTVDLELEGPESSLVVRRGGLRRFEDTHFEVGVGEWHPSDHLTTSEAPFSPPKGEAIRVEGIELYREPPARKESRMNGRADG